MNIGEIMITDIESVLPGDPVQDVANLIIRKNLRAVPVVDQNGDVQGIITEEDLIYQMAYRIPPAHIRILGEEIFLDDIFEATKSDKKKLLAKTAGELMNETVLSVRVDSDIKDVATIMLENGVDSILVMDGEDVKGIVTRHEIVMSYTMKNSDMKKEDENKDKE